MKGTVLGERYELIEKIGEGGMALVYKAHCRILNRTVAVKILKEEFASDQNFVEKFKTEALAVAQLSHPNIVNIFDVGQLDEVYYIVMEYVEGKTLNETIHERGSLSVDEAIDISAMICDGLHEAHEKGIIHRDIKPHNILITGSGIVKVADFGIAQAISKKTITFAGDILGTVHYISPEQAKGEPVNRATDIYSLGCVLYEMLTGKMPFDSENTITIALKHIHDQAVPPRSINKDIPPVLEAIILKAMEKLPENRFASAEEMRLALLNMDSDRALKYSNNRNGRTRVMSPIFNSQDHSIKNRKRIRPAALVIISLAVLGLLTGFFFIMSESVFGNEVVVPELTGMTEKEAKEELEKLGLKMYISYKFDEKIARDLIISQKPADGQKVKEGREITVVVSKGSQLVQVPSVRGLTLADAEMRLNSEGLKVGKKDKIYDDKFAVDVVISQDPLPGSEVESHSEINLMISRGKTPKKVSMPDLIGLSLEDAQKKIQDNNLLSGTIKRQESTAFFANQVIEQDTGSGVMIPEQSSINLVISDGPGPSARTTVLEFTLPEQEDKYRVVVIFSDAKGKSTIYNELRPAAETITLAVNYFASGTAEVQLNGKHHKTFSL